MESFTSEIVAPVPVYNANMDLLVLLAKELQEEREKNINLARNLALEKHKTQQLECYFMSLSSSQNKRTLPTDSTGKNLPRLESSETLASSNDLCEEKPQIGIYPNEVRRKKIQKYKEKIKQYRAKVHVSRTFSGRSVVAKIKPRVNGKFVKIESCDNLSGLS